MLPLPTENLILVDVLFMESYLPAFAGDTQKGTQGKQLFWEAGSHVGTHVERSAATGTG